MSTRNEFSEFYAARRRRRHQPAAANISSTKVAGSGTATFALATEPLPAVWPKWAPDVVVVLRVEAAGVFAPDDVVGGVDGAVEVENHLAFSLTVNRYEYDAENNLRNEHGSEDGDAVGDEDAPGAVSESGREGELAQIVERTGPTVAIAGVEATKLKELMV